MSGICIYCGFSGTNDEMAEHAGEMCHNVEEPLIKNEHLEEYRKRIKNEKPSVFDDENLYKKFGGV